MSYDFKTLKEQEIIEFLREINFEIHDNKALHRPDPIFVTEVLATVFPFLFSLLISLF